MHTNTKKRFGLTLTELVVVVGIIVIVSGVMVPLIQPVLKGQNIREAARITSVFFSSAQARAVEKGRPVGVWIQRAEHELIPGKERGIYSAFRLYMAEEPAPYSGDTETARLEFAFELPGLPPATAPQSYVYAFSTLPDCLMAVPNQAIPQGNPNHYRMVKPGDTIRFDYRDSWVGSSIPGSAPVGRFRISNVARSTAPNGSMIPSGTPILAFRVDVPPTLLASVIKYNGRQVPFQIYRQPRKTSAAPVEMPRGTALDLSVSGVGEDNLAKFRYQAIGLPEVCPEHDIVIMFSPDGGIDRVHYLDPQDEVTKTCFPLLAGGLGGISQSREVLGPVHLLIGRDDLVGLDSNKTLTVPSTLTSLSDIQKLNQANVGEANLLETTNIWLSIVGNRVTTSPNAGILPGVNTPLQNMLPNVFFGHVQHARQLSRSGLNMGAQ